MNKLLIHSLKGQNPYHIGKGRQKRSRGESGSIDKSVEDYWQLERGIARRKDLRLPSRIFTLECLKKLGED